MARRKSRTSRVSRVQKRSRTSRVQRRGKRSRTSRIQKRSRTSRVSRRGKRSRTLRVSRRGKRSRTLRGGSLEQLIAEESYPWKKAFYEKWKEKSKVNGYKEMSTASTHNVKGYAQKVQTWVNNLKKKGFDVNVTDVVNDLEFEKPMMDPHNHPGWKFPMSYQGNYIL